MELLIFYATCFCAILRECGSQCDLPPSLLPYVTLYPCLVHWFWGAHLIKLLNLQLRYLVWLSPALELEAVWKPPLGQPYVGPFVSKAKAVGLRESKRSRCKKFSKRDYSLRFGCRGTWGKEKMWMYGNCITLDPGENQLLFTPLGHWHAPTSISPFFAWAPLLCCFIFLKSDNLCLQQ